MNLEPITQNSFSKAIQLLKKNNLPTEDITDRTTLFAIVDQNEVVATIGIELYRRHALLRSLAVNGEYRNRGLAKELVDHIEAYAKQNGANELVLLTTTASEYFSKRGYSIIERDTVPEEIKRSSEFSSVCPSSAIVMKKNL